MTTQAPDIFIAVDATGKAASRRVHLYEDCSFVKDDTLKRLSPAEQQLLGLKQCTVCERRRAGGPAIEVLEGFFGEDWPDPLTDAPDPRESAWRLYSYLREHNWYLAQRKPKVSE